MKRRALIATALTAPPLLSSGCANRAALATSANPAQAQITVLSDAFGSVPGLTKAIPGCHFGGFLPSLILAPVLRL